MTKSDTRFLVVGVILMAITLSIPLFVDSTLLKRLIQSLMLIATTWTLIVGVKGKIYRGEKINIWHILLVLVIGSIVFFALRYLLK